MFPFFLKKIFLRKPLFLVVFFALFIMLNYITFTTSRTVFSTLEGSQESATINKSGMYVANLDPNDTPDIGAISKLDIQEVYDYLHNHYNYAFYTDGYIIDLPNSQNMEVSIVYMNELYDQLKGFPISAGDKFSFDYNRNNQDPIPVYVGAGLSKDYPIGKIFTITAPGLDREVPVQVQGILSPDVSHSNYYALDSKQYFNFSIVFPVNDDFIREASIPVKLNGLMDLIIQDTNKQKLADLASYIEQKIHVKYNFYGQQENNDFYKEYFVSSMKFIVILTIILLLSIAVMALWSSLSNIHIIIKEFTLNLLVGLSYRKLRSILYAFYFTISLVSTSIIFALAEYSRWQAWVNKDAAFAVYGFAGLITMDWMALLVTAIISVILTIFIVEIAMWKIRRIPISVGVLQ